jgi:hypothetical protein
MTPSQARIAARVEARCNNIDSNNDNTTTTITPSHQALHVEKPAKRRGSRAPSFDGCFTNKATKWHPRFTASTCHFDEFTRPYAPRRDGRCQTKIEQKDCLVHGATKKVHWVLRNPRPRRSPISSHQRILEKRSPTFSIQIVGILWATPTWMSKTDTKYVRFCMFGYEEHIQPYPEYRGHGTNGKHSWPGLSVDFFHYFGHLNIIEIVYRNN